MQEKKRRPALVLPSKCLKYLGLSWGLLSVLSCRPASVQPDGAPAFTASEKAIIQSLSPRPQAPQNPSNRWANQPSAAHFGRYLFYEPRLSLKGNLSCSSCHHPGLGWSDGKPLAIGLKTTTRNSPTLWNIAYQRWLFWDGRSDSIWSQAIQPLESLAEMGMSRVALLHTFHKHPDLRKGYEALFGPLPSQAGLPAQGRPVPDDPQHPLQRQWSQLKLKQQEQVNRFASNLGKALEAFERQIVSGESSFDRFAADMEKQPSQQSHALSIDAQKGLRLFIGRGQCILCHTGPLFNDREFHNLGFPKHPNLPIDKGRYAGISKLLADPLNGLGPFSDLPNREDPWNDKLLYLTRQNSNQGEFKTPGLREISRTGPYMHDGRFKTLEEVLLFYSIGTNQPPATGRKEDTIQPLNFKPEEMRYLIAFLKSLEGPQPGPELSQKPTNPVYEKP
jgi:cytochrome c peroxidase